MENIPQIKKKKEIHSLLAVLRKVDCPLTPLRAKLPFQMLFRIYFAMFIMTVQDVHVLEIHRGVYL